MASPGAWLFRAAKEEVPLAGIVPEVFFYAELGASVGIVNWMFTDDMLVSSARILWFPLCLPRNLPVLKSHKKTGPETLTW